jgi:hypothetical protein
MRFIVPFTKSREMRAESRKRLGPGSMTGWLRHFSALYSLLSALSQSEVHHG